MIHARNDYNRIQDPLSESPSTLEALAFAKSVIQSGEEWTPKCEEIIQAAIDRERAYREMLTHGSTPIAYDEPVMLFRAQDKHMEDVLLNYIDLVSRDDESSEEDRTAIIVSVSKQVDRVYAWQRCHGSKSPDLAKDAPSNTGASD